MEVDPRLTEPDMVKKWERWAKKKLAASALALLISVALLFFAFSGIAMPLHSDPGDWFQRSGAAVTVFCVYNQQLLASLSKALLPSPGSFADMSKVAVWRKFMADVPLLERFNFGIMLFATLVWGYGDIVRRSIVSLLAS